MTGLDLLGADSTPTPATGNPAAGVVTRGDAIIIGILYVMLGIEFINLYLSVRDRRKVR